MPEPKIYEAAWHAANSVLPLYGPILDPRSYINHILGTQWWVDHYPHGSLPVEVEIVPDSDVAGVARTFDDRCLIILGGDTTWNPDERPASQEVWVILHELAHLLVPYSDDSKDGHHGPQFVNSYIALVERFMGPHAAYALLLECRIAKIRINYRNWKHLA